MNKRTIILTLIFITAFLLTACTTTNGQKSELSWTEAEPLILSGDVWQIAQTHDLEVTLYLGDGQIITTMEPYLGAVFQVVADCGEPCTEIVISDAFTVEIHQGDEFRVTIEIDETWLEYLEVSQSEQQLKIGLRPHTGIVPNFEPVRRAEITMPSLVGVHLDNASSLKGEFDTGDIWFIVDNASDLTLTGQGQNLTLQVEEASSVNLSNFAVQDATITVINASSAIVDVVGRLDAEANNASSIAYYGNPRLGNTHITLASSITPQDR